MSHHDAYRYVLHQGWLTLAQVRAAEGLTTKPPQSPPTDEPGDQGETNG